VPVEEKEARREGSYIDRTVRAEETEGSEG
jgi:hypothetical protein